MKNKYYIILLMILALSCSKKKEEIPKEEGISKAFIKNIRTTKAILSTQEEELTLTGKVEYNPDRVINYVTLVSGVIERTYFSLGDKVQKGQVLLDLKSTDLSALQTEYANLQSELKITEREFESAKAMFADNMLSEKELLEAESKVKQTKATLNKMKGDMSVFGFSKNNGTFSVKSPITGYIVDKNITSGSTISADSDPLFTIADLSEVWITANVYAGNLQFVKENMEVSITTLSYPDEVFKGKINKLAKVFHPEDKVLKARIVMPNTNLKLMPEMSVVVLLKSETKNKLISIPSDALVFDDNKYFVVVVENPEKFRIERVELQGHYSETTYIRSGLNEGDNVVVENQLLIYSGLNEK